MEFLAKIKRVTVGVTTVDVATFIVILFHVCGCIGMFTSKREWFIANTPLNLLICFVLVLITQRQRNAAFIGFMLLAFSTGMIVETVGVQTGYLFGNYSYGTVLGPGFNSVPWLIGINWFIVVYSCGAVTSIIYKKIKTMYRQQKQGVPARLSKLMFVVDAALITTFYDWIMEPVAVKLGFWTWENDQVPLFNYACWFIISALLLAVFRVLRFDKQNHFAVHLLVIQLLFFGILRTFL